MDGVGAEQGLRMKQFRKVRRQTCGVLVAAVPAFGKALLEVRGQACEIRETALMMLRGSHLYSVEEFLQLQASYTIVSYVAVVLHPGDSAAPGMEQIQPYILIMCAGLERLRS